MKKFLLIILLLILPAQSLAVCGQNKDNIILFDNDEKIINSYYILASQEKSGEYKVHSFCIEGMCFSEYFEGNGLNIYFFKITDNLIKNKIDEEIIKTQGDIIKDDPIVKNGSSLLRLYTNDRLLRNKSLTSEILNSLNYNERTSFFNPEIIPNNFSYDDCSYERYIEYDLNSKEVTFTDSTMEGFVKYNNHNSKFLAVGLLTTGLLTAVTILGLLLIFLKKKKNNK